MTTEYIRALEQRKRDRRVGMFWGFLISMSTVGASFFFGLGVAVGTLIAWLFAFVLYFLFVGVSKESGSYADANERFATFRSGGTPSGL